ncbi:MAG: C4-dicarboxylate ABC transporter [Rhodospirillaceae bacterium]|nr:C4-dicarboxylate ABC transporter [Rhodospirillaceae bacterium]
MKVAVVISALAGIVVGALIGALFLAPRLTDSTSPAAAVSDKGSSAADVAAEPAVHWRMGSAYPSTMAISGTAGKRFERRIALVSNGNIEIRFFEPGALVPALELFDAVSAGSVDASFATAGYWAGKVPAAQFFTTVPFGPRLPETLAWLHYGGGLELWRELYRPYNVYPIPCYMNAAEGSGWFRHPIDTLDDLKGLKMRFFGLGARAMEKLGVSTQLLAGGDIYPALELGTIDATEFSMPVLDEGLGFQEIAKNYYFPGWHQPDSVGELNVNLDRWNALTERQQALIETVCGDNIIASWADSEASQFGPLQRLQTQGVVLHRWPKEFLEAFHKAWEEVRAEESATDPDFARVSDSLAAFHEEYRIWRDLSALPN